MRRNMMLVRRRNRRLGRRRNRRFVFVTKSFSVINEALCCYYYLGVVSFKIIIVRVITINQYFILSFFG